MCILFIWLIVSSFCFYGKSTLHYISVIRSSHKHIHRYYIRLVVSYSTYVWARTFPFVCKHDLKNHPSTPYPIMPSYASRPVQRTLPFPALRTLRLAPSLIQRYQIKRSIAKLDREIPRPRPLDLENGRRVHSPQRIQYLHRRRIVVDP